MSAPRKRLLPFFLPMAGCPHICVYCDQRAVSGQGAAPSFDQVRCALAAFPGGEGAELAYYGGSFTCLPREEQAAWLDLAAPYIAAGRLGGVRVSTRPDAVDGESCRFLRERGVTTVELGLQSMDDGVLEASGRGCTARQNRAACLAVQQAGLTLGGQLMIGLPQDSPRLALDSLRQVLELGCRLLRIYPTLVLRDTDLARRLAAGSYAPLSLRQAVELCADMLDLAAEAGATVQRLGLPPSPQLEAGLVAGPYHPAFGGLVKEEVLQRKALALLAGEQERLRGGAVLYCHQADLPLLFGQKKTGRERLERTCPGLRLQGDAALAPGELRLEHHTQEK